MSANEFGGGMYHDISAVLNRANQIRCAKGIVNHQRQTMPVGNFCNGVDIRNITVRIPQRLQINRPRIFPNSSLHFRQVMYVYKGCRDAIMGKRMRQQVIAASVNGLLGNDMPAVRRKRLDSIGDSRRA